MNKSVNDFSEEEYKKYFFQSKYYKSLGVIRHIFTCLRISQYKFTKHKIGEWSYSHRLNPYNPLSYITVLVALVVAHIVLIIKFFPELVEEIRGSFKYK